MYLNLCLCLVAMLLPPSADQILTEGRTVLEGGIQTAGFPGTKWTMVVDSPTGCTVAIDAACTSDHCSVDVVVGRVSGDVADADPGVADAERIALPRQRSVTRLATLPAGRHELSIHKRNEGWQGLIRVHGWQTDGTFLTPASPPDRRLLFIGDSITAGSGIDAAVDSTSEDDATLSNARLTFARQLADRLDSQAHLIAYGGRGLVRDWQSIRDTNNAPQFYRWALPDDAGRPWDPATYVPDAVVIALGTNDFNPGIPERELWVAAMVEFVRDIRNDFERPDLPVFLLSSPMHGEQTQERRLHVNYLRQAAKRSGDNVQVVEVNHHPGRQIDSHPIAPEHTQMANQLHPIIATALGWNAPNSHQR